MIVAWQLHTVLSGTVGTSFGVSDVSGDGTRIVVGAVRTTPVPDLDPGADGEHPSGAAMGAVYVYVLIDGDWVVESELSPTVDRVPDFGGFVAISDDGSTVVVGGISDGSYTFRTDGEPDLPGGHLNGGAIWIFVRDPDTNTWSEQAKFEDLDISTFGSGANGTEDFGWSVGISGDGNVICAVSAESTDPSSLITGNGYVRLFTREEGGGDWGDERLVPGDEHAFVPPGHDDFIGPGYRACDVSGDGKTVVFGGPNTELHGHFFTWAKDPILGWTEFGSGGISPEMVVGFICETSNGLSLSWDGLKVYAGASSTGGGWLYGRADHASDWELVQTLEPSTDGAASTMGFFHDGLSGVVGAPRDSAGLAYFMRPDVDTGEWFTYDSVSGAAEQTFGYTVGLSTDGRTLVIGAPDSIDHAPEDSAGAVYIYVNPALLSVSFDGIEYAG